MASDCAGQDIGEYSPQFTYPPANGQQLRVHNGNTFINNSAVNNRNRSRTTDYDNPPDLDNQFAQIPIYMQPEPLQIRKPSDPIRVAKSSQALNDNNPYNNVSASPIYPPRTSSFYGVTELRDSAGFRAQKKSHRRQPSDDPSVHRSTLSSCKGAYLSGASVDMSPSMDTHSSVSSHHGHSVIIGNFVPLVKATTAASSTMSASKNAVDGHSNHSQRRVPNPYQFEPDTPYVNEQRQTKFSDFMEEQNHASNPSPRMGHTKNSRSEDMYITEDYHALLQQPPMPAFTLHRSESSPNLASSPFQAPAFRASSPAIPNYYGDGGQFSLPGRQRTPSPSRSRRAYNPGSNTNSYNRQRLQSPVRSHSPIRSHTPLRRDLNDVKDSVQHISTRGRHPGNLINSLADVVEGNEYFNASQRERTPSPPKKRSRSPMKKMFGEHGWLGKSPDEVDDVKLQYQKASAPRKEKRSVIGKIRNKFDEIAEKADMSPSRNGRSNDKHPKISVLSVSLGPPEQARLLMEVELMIVHTASSFLMNQFSQGRINVDSIKKTVDGWKGKGRHMVIEFMYDQMTQRDLVAANQHNLRFFGERAGNSTRVNSMLYNWRQVASTMAIRTFCDADTVILKLLFDVEQVLELLGGAEAIMLRLQQIRAGANEMMRLARQRKETQLNGQTGSRGNTWVSQSSNSTNSRGPSVDEYGGMKLIPDSDKEYD